MNKRMTVTLNDIRAVIRKEWPYRKQLPLNFSLNLGDWVEFHDFTVEREPRVPPYTGMGSIPRVGRVTAPK